jgi:small neutral amino acid transporter SnatA (MarC family)
MFGAGVPNPLALLAAPFIAVVFTAFLFWGSAALLARLGRQGIHSISRLKLLGYSLLTVSLAAVFPLALAIAFVSAFIWYFSYFELVELHFRVNDRRAAFVTSTLLAGLVLLGLFLAGLALWQLWTH